MGGFNAAIRKQQQGEVSIEKFECTERNEKGQWLKEFSESENFYITNSFFQEIH